MLQYVTIGDPRESAELTFSWLVLARIRPPTTMTGLTIGMGVKVDKNNWDDDQHHEDAGCGRGCGKHG